jgi:hypothetical protein
MRGGAGSCCEAGLLRALRFATAASVRRKVAIYVGDGGGTCSASGVNEQQTLARSNGRTQQRRQVPADRLSPVVASGQSSTPGSLRRRPESDKNLTRIRAGGASGAARVGSARKTAMSGLRGVCCSVVWANGLSLALLLGTSGLAQTIGGAAAQKENLDLPFDAVGEEEGEEESPEVVVFYGQQIEGDGFFYTVDRSGSMLDRGELARAKQEISRNISEFSTRTEFGVTFFDSGVEVFPSSGRGIFASPPMKAAALAWITGIQGGRGSCCELGLLQALRMANLSAARRKVVIYVGDGGGQCRNSGIGEQNYLERTLQTVSTQNYQRAQINTIGVLMGTDRVMQEMFLQALARMNRGTYKRIN